MFFACHDKTAATACSPFPVKRRTLPLNYSYSNEQNDSDEITQNKAHKKHPENIVIIIRQKLKLTCKGERVSEVSHKGQF